MDWDLEQPSLLRYNIKKVDKGYMMYEKVLNRIRREIDKTYYMNRRYYFISTFALLYHKHALNVNELGSFLRVSDHFLAIDENHYFINFTFSRQANAFKAAENLLLYLDRHFNDNTTCIALDTFDNSKTPQMVMNRLVQILDATKNHSYERIEDENILNELV